MNVIESLKIAAQKQPYGIGLKIPQRNFWGKLSYHEKTFFEMDHEADVWATYFLSRKFTYGKKVLLLLPPGEDLILAVFAMLRLGAIPIIIDPGMGLKNFFNCVRKTNPELFLGCLRACFLYYALKPFVHFTDAIFLTKRLKDKLRKQNFACQLHLDRRGKDTSAILFTSGSTGYPKGTLYTYDEFDAQIKALLSTFNLQPGEADLPLLPVFSLYNPAMGITTIVPEIDPAHPSAFDPKKIVQSILKERVTNSFGSPRLWEKIADYCEQKQIKLLTMKRIFLAGAPVHPLLLKRVQTLIPNGQAFTPYGATEALPIAYISAKEVIENTCQYTLQGHGTCVGHAVKGVSIRIIPISDLPLQQLPDALPTGMIGEIAVSAPYISQGYLNDDVATRMAKIRDNGGVIWHRMGDVGYQDTYGRLWFCGRKAERVITNERTFYTDCCETIFNAHNAVFRSALIAFKSKTGTVPAIVIEPRQPLPVQAIKILFQELRTLAKSCKSTNTISHFCLYKNFPVDVRHNAKIHRLKLMQYFEKHADQVMALP